MRPNILALVVNLFFEAFYVRYFLVYYTLLKIKFLKVFSIPSIARLLCPDLVESFRQDCSNFVLKF